MRCKDIENHPTSYHHNPASYVHCAYYKFDALVEMKHIGWSKKPPSDVDLPILVKGNLSWTTID